MCKSQITPVRYRVALQVGLAFLMCIPGLVRIASASNSDRYPQPSPESVEAARQTILRVYRPDYEKAESQTQKYLLADKLFEIAKNTTDNPAAEFVLLMEAHRLAVEGGKVSTAFETASFLAAHFEDIDDLSLKAAACGKLVGDQYLLATAKEVADRAAGAADLAISRDRYRIAIQFLEAGRIAASRTRNQRVLAQIDELFEDVTALESQHSEYEKALRSLEADSNDKAAHAVAGRYLSLSRHQWQAAERHLRLAGEGELQTLVARQFSKPSDVQERLALADDWWSFAEPQGSAAQLQARVIAALHYRELVDHLTGFTGRLADERLQSVPSRALSRIPLDRPEQVRVAICKIFGDPWPSLTATLDQGGYQHALCADSDDFERVLKDFDMIIIPGTGYARTRLPSDHEVQQLVEFVSRGGTAVFAGKAWSWVNEKYGNKPLESFPLNRFGRALGFRVAARYASAPDNGTIHGKLKKRGVSEVRRKGRWTASAVDSSSPEAEILLRDESGGAMVALVPYKRGRIIVAGDESIFDENPHLFHACLQLLQMRDAGRETGR